MKNPDISRLEHTSWRCQYHVVFAPKYRRMEIYREIRADIGVILRKLCQQKGVEIIEANACPDHIHMLISIPPKYSVSQIMGYLKGKSSLMIFDRHANLKYKYGNRHFWARGYFVDTVGRNKKAIKAYIQNQLQEDQIADQISIKEFVDPFTGSKNTKAYQNPRKGLPEKAKRSANLFGPLKGLCPYKALIGLTQASGLAGGFDYSVSLRISLCWSTTLMDSSSRFSVSGSSST